MVSEGVRIQPRMGILLKESSIVPFYMPSPPPFQGLISSVPASNHPFIHSSIYIYLYIYTRNNNNNNNLVAKFLATPSKRAHPRSLSKRVIV